MNDGHSTQSRDGGRSENLGGHNLPSLVEIGLTNVEIGLTNLLQYEGGGGHAPSGPQFRHLYRALELTS